VDLVVVLDRIVETEIAGQVVPVASRTETAMR
jgi:hypothetical protein